MAFTNFAGVDEELKFPPGVRQAIASSTEVTTKIEEIVDQAIDDSPVGEQALRFCSLAMSNDINAPYVTETAVPWNVEVEDPNNLHSATNPSRVIANMAGLYLVTFTVQFSGAAGGSRALILKKNNVKVFDRTTPSNGAVAFAASESEVVRLSVGDYVTVSVWHDVAAGLTLGYTAGGANATSITVSRIGS